jgi:hypothetical protein
VFAAFTQNIFTKNVTFFSEAWNHKYFKRIERILNSKNYPESQLSKKYLAVNFGSLDRSKTFLQKNSKRARAWVEKKQICKAATVICFLVKQNWTAADFLLPVFFDLFLFSVAVV